MAETPPKTDPASGQPTSGAASTAEAATAPRAHDSELTETPRPAGERALDLDFILDIPLTVHVEVGRTKLLIQELLQLGQGSVIELDKLLGEPFEVLVNEKLVARGEIVVVNDRFGVRLTDIISATERIQSLG
jgi:flagellar motor switch protein FliN/FliY